MSLVRWLAWGVVNDTDLPQEDFLRMRKQLRQELAVHGLRVKYTGATRVVRLIGKKNTKSMGSRRYVIGNGTLQQVARWAMKVIEPENYGGDECSKR